MNNFDYYAPTKVVFGKDTEKETGRLVKEQGASSVLVHFGGKSAIASGLLDRVCQSLKEEGIAYEMLGGVVPNPRLSKVKEGIALCREKKIDFILAVGGGSVIDSAKAIGYGAPAPSVPSPLPSKTFPLIESLFAAFSKWQPELNDGSCLFVWD